jgi:hypothetical protein
MVLGGLCGALIAGLFTFPVLLVITSFFGTSRETYDLTCTWLRVGPLEHEGRRVILPLAIAVFSGTLTGAVVGFRLGNRSVRWGLGHVLGGAALGVLTGLTIVLNTPGMDELGHFRPHPVAVFGPSLAGIVGALLGLVVAFLRPAKTTPDTLPDPGWGSDAPPKEDMLTQSKD